MEKPQIDIDERLDTIPGTNLELVQKIDGTAFAIDTLLLANFVKYTHDMNFAADLGSGSGILTFLIKYRNEKLQITGFELQEVFYNLSMRNRKLNKHFSGIEFKNIDIRDIPSRILPESFDLVVSNPPYFPKGSGKLPSRNSRAIARHELNGTLKDFVETSSYMLTYGGRMCFVIPSERFYEIAEYLKPNNLGMRRLQFIFPKEGEKSHLVLIEAEKFYNGKHESLPNITIHKADNSYGDKVFDIFNKGLKIFNTRDNV